MLHIEEIRKCQQVNRSDLKEDKNDAEEDERRDDSLDFSRIDKSKLDHTNIS